MSKRFVSASILAVVYVILTALLTNTRWLSVNGVPRFDRWTGLRLPIDKTAIGATPLIVNTGLWVLGGMVLVMVLYWAMTTLADRSRAQRGRPSGETQ